MATIPGPGGLGFAIAAPYHGTVLATHGQVDLSYSEQQMFIEPKGIPRVLRRVKLSVVLGNFPLAVSMLVQRSEYGRRGCPPPHPTLARGG
jgi:hypothetical protein